MEYLDVVDENNNLTGQVVDRNTAHKELLYHRHVSCWIMDLKGRVLLQQRALIKSNNPGMWAKTGGHVDSGETPIEAVKREVYEEIGLVINEKCLTEVAIYKSQRPTSAYFTYNYLLVQEIDIDKLVLQKEEVESVKLFEIEELIEDKKNNPQNYTFSKWKDEEFDTQMNLLKAAREKILKE